MLCRLAALPLCVLASPAFAQQLETIQLRHQTPDRVLPILQPLLAPGGTLTGFNDKLFLRTTPDNRKQILQVLAEIDTPLRQLIIQVRSQGSRSQGQRGFSMGGDVVVGGSGTRIEGSVRDSERTRSSSGEQRIRATEGSPAFIQVGRSFAIPLREVVIGPNRTIIRESTVWRDVGSGFHAVPRVSGQRVTLEISQFADTATSRRGDADTRQLSTTISGQLGEWIELGGTTASDQSHGSDLLGRGSHREASQQSIWLKVDLAQ
ncbi:MAG: hypothetical protein LPJ91_06610 [Pseudazoarcus pumilus]|nr:hypothetical protein [Pseudazoarcus pumilus]